MKQLELRPAARRDLLRHERHLQSHSPRAALRMFDRLTRINAFFMIRDQVGVGGNVIVHARRRT